MARNPFSFALFGIWEHSPPSLFIETGLVLGVRQPADCFWLETLRYMARKLNPLCSCCVACLWNSSLFHLQTIRNQPKNHKVLNVNTQNHWFVMAYYYFHPSVCPLSVVPFTCCCVDNMFSTRYIWIYIYTFENALVWALHHSRWDGNFVLCLLSLISYLEILSGSKATSLFHE